MKNYKLIKEYPGSPKLGYIYSPEQFKEYCNYKEYWEEIVEKDYEILSVLIRRSDKHQQKIVDANDSDDYITSLINCDGNSIYSVKRLSDGEIFTLGDQVGSTIADLGRTTVLVDFEMQDNNIEFNLGGWGYYPLSTILKLKTPLFTTEDGVDIFEGDSTYNVYKNSFHLSDKIKYNNKFYTYNHNFSAHLTFSTKEKAEEYILMNKPCLSLKNVQDMFFEGLKDVNEGFLHKLENLVKSKLNN